MDIKQFKKLMDKKFGEGALMQLGGENEGIQVEAITTGLPSLDYAVGNGGLARGRIVEIFGPESGGKTSLASFIVAQAQKLAGGYPKTADGHKPEKPISGRIGFVDVEHTFDPVFAQKIGVQIGPESGFYLSQPSSGNQALDEIQMMVESGLFDYIVLDSVAGLLSDAEAEADHGERQIAQVATLMSTAMRKLTGAISSSKTIVIFINQIREKPAVLYGSPETTPGGRALKFAATYRFRVSKKQQIKKGQTVVGHTMKIRAEKNKVSSPFKFTEIDFYYEEVGEVGSKDYHPVGFDLFKDMLTHARSAGVISLSGSKYTFTDPDTGEILLQANGQVQLHDLLQSNEDIRLRLLEVMANESI